MKYFVDGPGDPLEIELQDQGDGKYLIKVAGRQIQGHIQDVDRIGQYAVSLDEQSFAASIEASQDPTDLHVAIAGLRWHFRIRDEREEAAGALESAAGGRAENIQAMMPGLVAKIMVEVGHVLEPGSPVLVLEAMKMQNEVVTEQGGRIAEIFVQEGKAVETGSNMVRLEPFEEG